jgi:hypothetical protein
VKQAEVEVVTAPRLRDAFISYAHADKERCVQLAGLIEAAGYDVWVDNEDIRDGEAFDTQIEEAIASSRLVVVLWSAASVKSRWVRAEAAYALERNKLVPVLLDGVEPPLQFMHIQAIDLYSGEDLAASTQVQRLIDSLATRLRRPRETPAVRRPFAPLQQSSPRARLLERIWLAFSDPEQEKHFRLYYRSRVYAAARFAILLGSVAFALFGLIDTLVPGGGLEATRFRFLVAFPATLLFYPMSRLAWVQDRWEPFVAIFGLVGLALMFQITVRAAAIDSSALAPDHNYGSMNFLALASFIPLIQLRTLYSVALSLALLAAHFVYVTVFARLDERAVTLTNLFVILGVSVACCITYWREQSHRKAFASR